MEKTVRPIDRDKRRIHLAATRRTSQHRLPTSHADGREYKRPLEGLSVPVLTLFDRSSPFGADPTTINTQALTGVMI